MAIVEGGPTITRGITLRFDKGSELTHAELDENFIYLDDMIRNIQNTINDLDQRLKELEPETFEG